jgi:cobalamin synthase
MDLKKTVNLTLALFAVLSLVTLVAVLTASNKATSIELEILALVNVLSAVFGLVRVTTVKEHGPEGSEKFGKIGAQHSWLTFSVTTAVLSLLFGKYFADNAATVAIQVVLLTVISLLAVFMIVDVARKKIYFLD